ncbi:hypothetical protein A0256_03660 [Mucilaginibacter sp. PAMC 26640]|nr:hypothetical protein A0256_03660 [Mucilaginibacter sp. PAMC 26640]
MNVQQKKILVLDDTEDIINLIKDILSEEDYEVKGFTHTDDIIKLIKAEKPDLVLIDYLLTGINGGEFCHQIKKHEDTAHTPVIMLSAHARVLNSLGNYGWDAFIEKPFDIDDLKQTVKHVLNHNAELSLTMKAS